MTTLTKFKGQIDNPDLMVLTSNGLVNQTIGKFAVMLDEQGYTMNAQQESAVETFINNLKAAGLTSKILSLYPFIGSTTSPTAAGVPLFGEKLLEFPDDFDGFVESSGIINGISKMPAVSSFKLKDVIPDKQFIGYAFSGNKTATANTNLVKFAVFGNDNIQFRLSLSSRTPEIYGTRSGGSGSFNSPDSSSESKRKMAGSLYAGILVDNRDNQEVYGTGVLAPTMETPWKKSGNTRSSTSSNKANFVFTDSDLECTLHSQSGFQEFYNLTSLVFFKERLYFDGSNKFIELLESLKQFMIDLGRHIADE